MDLISVIVPIYKVEAYLDRCVRSIAEQTYENLEIILVDDGSPDSCGAMCDAWAEHDHRVKVIHKENGGLSDARNAGLAVAIGEMIAFVDSDDSIEPEFLEKLHGVLVKQDADIAVCAVSFVDEEGNVLRQRHTAQVQSMDKMEALYRLVLEDGIYQTVWNKLYRREVIGKTAFAAGKCHEDEFWTYQVFDRIEKLAVVSQPMYNYLQRTSSIMGLGYNPRRLDGLEARFLRMDYLQKYEELAAMTRQQFVFDCMWHLQCAVRLRDNVQQKHAVKVILEYLKNTPRVPQSLLTANLKYRAWYLLFLAMPVTVARVRNLLRIGV